MVYVGKIWKMKRIAWKYIRRYAFFIPNHIHIQKKNPIFVIVLLKSIPCEGYGDNFLK